MDVRFDTKIAVVVDAALETWQKLNVTAFTVSGIAATVEGVTGEPYEDADGTRYLPMLRQPVLVFAAHDDQLRKVYERARSREASIAIFTRDLFETGHDDANRAAVRAVAAADLDLVGLALRAPRRDADRILKGLTMHG